jgi:hypothetical protein
LIITCCYWPTRNQFVSDSDGLGVFGSHQHIFREIDSSFYLLIRHLQEKKPTLTYNHIERPPLTFYDANGAHAADGKDGDAILDSNFPRGTVVLMDLNHLGNLPEKMAVISRSDSQSSNSAPPARQPNGSETAGKSHCAWTCGVRRNSSVLAVFQDISLTIVLQALI